MMCVTSSEKKGDNSAGMGMPINSIAKPERSVESRDIIPNTTLMST